MILTDTHTHLYTKEFDDDRNEVIHKCLSKGINRFFLPNIDTSTIKSMLELAQQFPKNCFPMMGLHPTSVKENYKEELNIIENYLDKKLFCAVGEIGMDLYWDKTFLKEQQTAFEFQINLAKKHNISFVIHCRDAFDEIFEILDQMNDEKMRGIFHCFTGNLEQANHIIGYGGFKLGIGGVVTFKNSGLDKVVENLKIENLVLETDSPYLAPTPFRGKRNESTYLYNIAKKIADIYNLDLETVAKITTKNTVEVFGF